jgi:WD40 repeat protein/DNA-binding XRE family transcriptional regulator
MADDWAGGQQNERFGRLLLRYRARTGLTQRELASRAGVAMRSIQGWETGLMYPGAGRLEALILRLLEAGAFSPGAELAEAEALWAAVEREAPRMHPPFEPEHFNALLAQRTRAAPAAPVAQSVAADLQTVGDSRQDWGDAPMVVDFVGRTAELARARQWVLEEHCRLLAVLGMGGIGKTSVAARIAQEVAPVFHHVYWRGLRNAPPVAEWMAGAISFLSGQQQIAPDGAANQLAALLRLLRDEPSLLVLDNFETLLEPAQLSGRYRETLAGYGAVLQAIGETSHRSCVIVTSREAPPDWTMLGGSGVRTLELGGLGSRESQALLAYKQLQGDDEEWADLVGRYGGNGLALKVVGESIRQVFGGDIGSFLAESRSGAVFGGIRRLLAEQFERSSPVEQAVVNALAVEREPVTIAELFREMGARVGRSSLVESVEALRLRSLVERAEVAGAGAFTLQSVVLEYVTDRLINKVCEEIALGTPVQLVAQPLIKAQAKEYVRLSQERLLGEPIIQHLKLEHGLEGAETLLIGLLDAWRDRSRGEQGFGPGNAVNLLRLLRGSIRGANLAQLALRQAYLAGVEAQDANLLNADLSQATLTETFNYPLSVALSADGTLLAAGTAGGEVCLWRVVDRTPLLQLQAHAGPVHRVALSDEGQLLVSASEDGTVRLWQVPEGQPLAVLSGHLSPVYAMALSTDSRLLASGSFDGSINLWDVPTQRLLATLQAHASPVWSVSLSTDASVLASGSFDGTVRLWDVASGQLLTSLEGHASPVWSVRLSADGSLLASGTEDGQVRLWDARTYQLVNTLREHTGSIRGVAFSADGRAVASASWDATVRLWSAADGRPEAVLEGHTGPVRSVAMSADGQIVASGSLDGSVRLWEARPARPLARLFGHTSPVYGVALNADGTLLASGSWNGTVELWDTAGGQKLATLSGHASPVYGVALSADGQLVASASWDRLARVANRWRPVGCHTAWAYWRRAQRGAECRGRPACQRQLGRHGSAVAHARWRADSGAAWPQRGGAHRSPERRRAPDCEWWPGRHCPTVANLRWRGGCSAGGDREPGVLCRRQRGRRRCGEWQLGWLAPRVGRPSRGSLCAGGARWRSSRGRALTGRFAADQWRPGREGPFVGCPRHPTPGNTGGPHQPRVRRRDDPRWPSCRHREFRRHRAYLGPCPRCLPSDPAQRSAVRADEHHRAQRSDGCSTRSADHAWCCRSGRLGGLNGGCDFQSRQRCSHSPSWSSTRSRPLQSRFPGPTSWSFCWRVNSFERGVWSWSPRAASF